MSWFYLLGLDMNQNQWGRETAPPIHRDPHRLRWVADWMIRQVAEHPHPSPRRIQWIPDPSFTPQEVSWLRSVVEDAYLASGQVVLLQRAEEPERPFPPTPGELLAASMRDLPALPPTAGGLCPPQKA